MKAHIVRIGEQTSQHLALESREFPKGGPPDGLVKCNQCSNTFIHRQGPTSGWQYVEASGIGSYNCQNHIQEIDRDIFGIFGHNYDFGNDRIQFTYTNWKGVTKTRKVKTKALYWGSTDYHPEPQFLLLAEDLNKDNAERHFALKDMRDVRVL